MRQYQGTTTNELLDYLKCLDTKALGQLTACAGEDIMEAMNAFIHRLLGSSDDEELRRIPSQSNAVELARLLFWCVPVCCGGPPTLSIFHVWLWMLLDSAVRMHLSGRIAGIHSLFVACQMERGRALMKVAPFSENHALCRLMCVGYGLRTLEVRFDMEQSMMLEERDAGLGYLPP